MKAILYFLSVLCFVVSFSSCQKDNVERVNGGNETRLKEIISTLGDSIFYQFFSYDSLNRVVSITDSDANNGKRITNIIYDERGYLAKAVYTHTSDSSYNRIFTFTTDDLGRVVQTDIAFAWEEKEKIIYTYGDDNRVQTYGYNNDSGLQNIRTIHNDEHYNDTGYSYTINYINDTVHIASSSRYDNMQNPYKSTGLLTLFIYNNTYCLNENNPLETTTFTSDNQSSSHTYYGYRYAYNDSGFPLTVTNSYTEYGHTYSSTLQYIYQ